MMLSVVIYAVLAELIKAQHKPFEGFSPLPQMEILKYLFYGLSVALIFAIKLIRGLFLKRNHSDDLKKLVQKLKVADVITYALCEVPAIWGLVLFLIAGAQQDFYILLFYSLALMFIYRPRYSRWEEWIGEASVFN
jgi:hypothetical protein